MEHFFSSRAWKVFLVTFSISAPIIFLSFFSDLFLILVLSVVLMFVLRPVVDRFENFGVSRTVSILAIYLLFGGAVVGLLVLLYPILVSQLTQLTTTFDAANMSLMVRQLGDSIAQKFPFLTSEAVIAKFNDVVMSAGSTAAASLSGMAGFAASILIVPFIAFFLLQDYHVFQKKFVENIPNKYFEMSLKVIRTLEEQLSKYIRGTVIESLIVSVLYIISYSLLGINYAIVLGLVGGITNIIPFAGPFIGAIPVLLVTIMQFGDLHLLIPVIISTIVVQQLDQIFVQPAVFSKIMSIHPLVMFLVILAGNEMLGVLGMVLAVPIYTIVTVTARETNWGLKNYKITQ
ncbi:MAG: AI-2E family transporter [Acidobacteriota bacterium]